MDTRLADPPLQDQRERGVPRQTRQQEGMTFMFLDPGRKSNKSSAVWQPSSLDKGLMSVRAEVNSRDFQCSRHVHGGARRTIMTRAA